MFSRGQGLETRQARVEDVMSFLQSLHDDQSVLTNNWVEESYGERSVD